MKNLGALTKPLAAITKEDLLDLIAAELTEGATIEFKRDLSAENGKPEPWLQGGEISKDAKQALFKEILAFANSYGGHLFVGIAETSHKPPRAASITSIPRIVDLADRLQKAIRDSIDPPLQAYDCEGVVTNDQGGGVLVIQVPPSRLAPHRSKRTCEAYRRHGERSEPMDMRAIQDLTLLRYQSDERFSKSIEEKHEALLKEPTSRSDQRQIGVHCVAIPLGERFYVPRLSAHPELAPVTECPPIDISGVAITPQRIAEEMRTMPVLRGLRRSGIGEYGVQFQETFADGSIHTVQSYESLPGDRVKITLSVYLYSLLTTAIAAHRHRSFHRAPFTEYAISMALYGRDLYYITDPARSSGRPPFGWISEASRRLPTYTLGSIEEINDLIAVFIQDLFNMAGAEVPADYRVHLDASQIEKAIKTHNGSAGS